MKTAIIITGRHEPTAQRYEDIGECFAENGWERVIRFNPNWELHSIQQLNDEFLRALQQYIRPLTLFGFSLGAMLALIASTKLEVENLILCSPSGYFKEYFPLLSDEDLEFAKEYVKDFESWSAKATIANSQVGKGFIVAGAKELVMWPDFKRWVSDLHNQTSWPLTIVPETAHEIESEKYQQAVKLVIKNLT